MGSYWINTVSEDHVLIGVEGGFTQANHGSPRNLKLIKKGDYVVFYSSKTKLKDGKALQKFTAIGAITDAEPYQIKLTETFHPFRRNVDFFQCNYVPIKPLINKLTFIKNKQRWGFSFMRGMFQIPQNDFMLIANEMGVEISE